MCMSLSTVSIGLNECHWESPIPIEKRRRESVCLPEPASIRPSPMHDDGIEKDGDEEGEDEVRLELTSLCDSSRNDRCGGGSECVLEEEPVV